jgi:hypothetical protein
MRVALPGAASTPPAPSDALPACAQHPTVYAQELLESPPAQSKVTKAVWAEYREQLDTVRAACAACPLLVDCLYRSVVQVDVAGYVGCTTPRERRLIRRVLGVSVAGEDLDDAAGVRIEGRPLDHATVLATRGAYPDDTFEQLALRLECSLSTVKRHLRRARKETSDGITRAKPVRAGAEVPTVDAVLDAFDSIVEDDR